jgi:hypothetical protein
MESPTSKDLGRRVENRISAWRPSGRSAAGVFGQPHFEAVRPRRRVVLVLHEVIGAILHFYRRRPVKSILRRLAERRDTRRAPLRPRGRRGYLSHAEPRPEPPAACTLQMLQRPRRSRLPTEARAARRSSPRSLTAVCRSICAVQKTWSGGRANTAPLCATATQSAPVIPSKSDQHGAFVSPRTASAPRATTQVANRGQCVFEQSAST